MGHALRRPANNLVVLTGNVTNDPTRRSLQSGVVVNFDLSTRVDDTTTSVPISWHDPSESAVASIVVGEEIVVVGTVRRRFFRADGQTQSRTEVVVDALAPARRKKSTHTLLAKAAAALTPEDG